ncbi:MAG: hypothetical protein OEX12_09185 [Gammaproteobacteria bacterium]|nr:hypothetical protein [Gammaproteobacteria bacterium]
MEERLMLLPCRKFDHPVLVVIPEDFGEEEAFRRVTGLIAEVEEESPDTYSREDILDALEAQGFVEVEYQLGPEMD